MFKQIFTYYVGATDRLHKVFTNKILPSGFINKGRCGIGGTHMEIYNLLRCSIIVVPNISIIKSKKAQNDDLYVVYGDISHEEVYGYLLEKKQGQKLITTPEGMRKIMWAAEQLGRTQEFYDEWFLMLDEAHTFITEDYREDIIAPFEYFWDFKNKCIISATPYYFSDPRMKELDCHEVRLTEKLGTVTLVKSLSVEATLDYILKHPDEFPANLHIAYNSVTEIVKAIERAGITDCNVYCANDKDNKNMEKLGEYKKFYVEQPDETNYRKINFYTCKYFEGWDMYDENATLILATNIHRGHTKVGIADKGVQFFGRLRGKKDTDEPAKPFQLIHITNCHYDSAISTDNIIKKSLHSANKMIEQYNSNQSDTEFKELVKVDVKRFADVDKVTKLAKLNTMRLDQLINEQVTTEIYKDMGLIRAAWERLYNVELQTSQLQMETRTTLKRKSRQQQFKEDYKALLAFKEERDNSNSKWSITGSIEQDIKKSNVLAAQAVELLDKETVEALKFSPSKIQKEVIFKSNELAEVKLLKLLDQYFKCGQFYTNEHIKSTLQSLYVKLGATNKDGKERVAQPAQLGEDGRFEIKPCKEEDKNGKWVHGYKILRKQFELLVAA